MMKIRFLLPLLVLMAVCGSALAAERPFETGIYISIYKMDSSSWSMTPKNPQYETYRKTDLDAILSRCKADGFDNIYLLPGDHLGKNVLWRTSLPFLRTKDEWIQAGRDLMEEFLTAADKNHQRVYLCLLGIQRDPAWWKQNFPEEDWFDAKGRNENSFIAQATKVAVPAMQEIVRKYGNHPSLVGFGTDEVIFSGDYFGKDGGWSDGMVGREAAALYRKRYNEEPPSMNPLPAKFDEKVDRLLACREEILVQYHRTLADAAKALGKEYTTTLNSSMLTKMRWEGLGGERAAFGSDVWRIGSLPSNSEVATDFYGTRLSSHIQADITKFIASPLYNKPINLVIGTQFGSDILAKHLIDTLAEGVERVTYWTNYYYYGDAVKGETWAAGDPERISYLVKASKEFRKRIPVRPRYDVGILLNREWQRNHYRTTSPAESEIAQMNYVVDNLNMGGYSYDILSEDEAAAGGLKGFSAVVVPLGVGINEKALSAMESYVKSGGMLLVRTGFGTQTPWGTPVSSEMKKRVDALLGSKRVVLVSESIADGPGNIVAAKLSAVGVRASSPLVSDTENLTMKDAHYDPYWAPRPKFGVNGKIYDLFWSGDRYKAISIGLRSNTEGKAYRIGRCEATLRSFQSLVAGKSAPGKDYDLFLINSNGPIKINASKVFVYGKDGQWTTKSAARGKKQVVLQGSTLVRIP